MLNGGKYWWVARSNEDAAEIIWPQLVMVLKDVAEYKNETRHYIRLPNGAEISVKSAQEPDALRGVGLDGVVCDEAAFFDQEAWTDSLRPALADKQGWAIFITTPQGHNWFYDLFQYAGHEDGWERWHRPTRDNPLITDAELAAARRENAIKFRQEYEADFEAVQGSIFRREWFTIVDEWPREFTKIVRYWDKAATAKSTADYSAGALLGAVNGFYGDEFYIVNVVRGQWSIDEREKMILRVAQMDRENFGPQVVTWIEQEGGSAGPESAKNTINRLAGFTVRANPVQGSGSKEIRAQPLSSQIQAGFVKLCRGPWNHEFIDEAIMFPNPKIHDDQVDAASGAFNKLANHARFEAMVY